MIQEHSAKEMRLKRSQSLTKAEDGNLGGLQTTPMLKLNTKNDNITVLDNAGKERRQAGLLTSRRRESRYKIESTGVLIDPYQESQPHLIKKQSTERKRELRYVHVVKRSQTRKASNSREQS